MSARTLPRPVSRIAAILLLVAVAAALWAGLAKPFLDRRAEARLAIETAQSQLKRFRAVIAQGAAPAPSAPPGALLAQQAPTLAAAALQQRLDQAIEAAGGVRDSVRPREPETLEAAMRIAVDVDARFSIAALTHFLREIETGDPFVFVEALEVRRFGGGDASPTEPTELSVSMTLAALMGR
jgi:hypothetical protein